jgi:hypothetical protein
MSVYNVKSGWRRCIQSFKRNLPIWESQFRKSKNRTSHHQDRRESLDHGWNVMALMLTWKCQITKLAQTFILGTVKNDKSIPVKKNICWFDRFGEINFIFLAQPISREKKTEITFSAKFSQEIIDVSQSLWN